MDLDFDVLIIGAGVIGLSIAREMSKFSAKIAVVEANIDACMETSAANSGIVHAGYDCKPNTLKAKFNVKGCSMFLKLSKDLDFPYKNTGSLVVAVNSEEHTVLENLLKKGKENGVKKFRIISGDEARKIEPCLSDKVISALYAETAGIVGPYEFGYALMENAASNGVSFFFNYRVSKIEQTKDDQRFKVFASNGNFLTSKYVINAAGVNSDDIARLIGDVSFTISARRGEYLLYDKTQDFDEKVRNRSEFMHKIPVQDMQNQIAVRMPVFPVPNAVGKGILASPTVHGNMFLGPTGEDTEEKHNTETTAFGAEKLLLSVQHSLQPFNKHAYITAFTGVRAICGEDFVIEKSKESPYFINVAGICSPGLTAAPAIGEYVVSLITEYPQRTDFIAERKAIPSFIDASDEEKAELINQYPMYGTIICRCESITEGEIVEAVKRGARSIDAVKRRVRAGAGRCQGGFCMPKVLHIMARELGEAEESITKRGGESQIVLGNVKEICYES